MNYQLVDYGAFERLEIFSNILVRRPCPIASLPKRLSTTQWQAADLCFSQRPHHKAVWTGQVPDNWCWESPGLTLQLTPAAGGQIGVFPEQSGNWSFLQQISAKLGLKTDKSAADKSAGQSLNLFAYTGAATLSLAQAGLTVVHVDIMKSAITRTRQNAILSGLESAPIRWIVDDAVKFVSRELKRGHKYNVIVLDPPAFGGSSKSRFELQRDFFPLLDNVTQLLTQPHCLLLTTHQAEFSTKLLTEWLQQRLPQDQINAEDLTIPCQSGQPPLWLGRYARATLLN